jgi:hypothetical protein
VTITDSSRKTPKGSEKELRLATRQTAQNRPLPPGSFYTLLKLLTNVSYQDVKNDSARIPRIPLIPREIFFRTTVQAISRKSLDWNCARKRQPAWGPTLPTPPTPLAPLLTPLETYICTKAMRSQWLTALKVRQSAEKARVLYRD